MSARGEGDARLVAQSREVLATHARSFRWAAVFLPAACRDDAAVLYAFCRRIDDAVDEAPSLAAARQALTRLADDLEREVPVDPLVRAFRQLSTTRGVPMSAARDLIAGAESDLGPVRMADDAALLEYCYRVAGTVGLMMSPLIGVATPEARQHAIDLGIAMQLTNICRDVREDATIDRVYLPATRLRAAGGGTEPSELEAKRDATRRVVLALLDRAEDFYASGRQGLRHIPWRPRLAIAIAARLYRAIGVKLRSRYDGDPMHGRTVVSWIGKTFELMRGFGDWIRGLAPAN